MSAKISNRGSFAIEKYRPLLADNFHQHPLAPVAVELAVEDLLPGTEIELAVGDGDDDLPAHHLPLDVRVGVVLAGVVVMVAV